jgi:hypothetical protein
MAVGAISQANGADLLNLLQQSQRIAAPSPSASAATLKTAVADAKYSEGEVLGGGSPDASLLNVHG